MPSFRLCRCGRLQRRCAPEWLDLRPNVKGRGERAADSSGTGRLPWVITGRSDVDGDQTLDGATTPRDLSCPGHDPGPWRDDRFAVARTGEQAIRDLR